MKFGTDKAVYQMIKIDID